MGREGKLAPGDWAYIGVAVVWSVVLFGAMGFLGRHHRLPQLRMRRLAVVFVAMISLHSCWMAVLIAYVLGPVYPCVAEYWVMSILLPFGIAIFQLANTQFLWIAIRQRRYVSIDILDGVKLDKRTLTLDGGAGSSWQSIRKKLETTDRITRMIVYVVIGIAIQVSQSYVVAHNDH